MGLFISGSKTPEVGLRETVLAYNTVEDEKHFLFSCNYMYAMDEKDSLLELINKYCKNFNNSDSDNKLTWRVTNENVQIHVQVCEMILKTGI